MRSRQLALRNNNGNGNVRKVHSSRARVRQWRAAFLRSLAKSPSVTIAARSARISTRACYKARDADPDFRDAWDASINQSVDTLEHEVFLRALKGDAQLAMFVLKAFRPHYRDSSRLEVDQRLVGVLVVPAKEDRPP